MATTVEVLSAGAALVSAVGGLFATRAAFLSANSARKAQESLDNAELRAALRDLVTTAGAILIETNRITERGDELKMTHRSLAIMSGMPSNTRLDQSLLSVDERLNKVVEHSKYAELFSTGAQSVDHCPLDEIGRIQVRLSNSLKTVEAMLQDFDREYNIIEGMCSERRQSLNSAA